MQLQAGRQEDQLRGVLTARGGVPGRQAMEGQEVRSGRGNRQCVAAQVTAGCAVAGSKDESYSELPGMCNCRDARFVLVCQSWLL